MQGLDLRLRGMDILQMYFSQQMHVGLSTMMHTTSSAMEVDMLSIWQRWFREALHAIDHVLQMDIHTGAHGALLAQAYKAHAVRLACFQPSGFTGNEWSF